MIIYLYVLSKLKLMNIPILSQVERLHADKHKLEDRLNLLEKSAVYESSILNKVWVEHEEFYDESIDDGVCTTDCDHLYAVVWKQPLKRTLSCKSSECLIN